MWRTPEDNTFAYAFNQSDNHELNNRLKALRSAG
jgi:hypothetical protein